MNNQKLAETLPTLPPESGRGYAENVSNEKAKLPFSGKDHLRRTSPQGRMKVKIHPEGRITDPKYAWRGVTDLYGLLADTPLRPRNKELLEAFLRDAELGKTIKGRAKKQIGPHRLLKYVQDLKKLDTYFRKDLDAVSLKDMEQFISDLQQGRFLKKNGKPYAPETQVCMKNVVSKFYRWLDRQELVEWFDTSFELKEYRAISKDQLDTILELLTSNTPANVVRNRAILAVLFDSGARADELLNIRLQDLTREQTDYKLRITVSKTKKRTLVLPLSSQYIDRWLQQHPARGEGLAQLFPLNYHALFNVVDRAGQVIGHKLTPHGLRHASATYWARHLSRYQLCHRFGWSMSSKQPDRYLDREGLGTEVVREAVEVDAVRKYAAENDDLRRRLAVMEEQLSQFMQQDLNELKAIIARVRTADSSEAVVSLPD